jgi:hypothetical protein
MLTITNKYALAEEATIDTRDQKKDKEPRHSDQPSTSMNNDKKRKSDLCMANVERPHCNKEYQPQLGEFEGLLDRICIFHPQGKHKTRDYDRLQGFADEVLKMAKKPIMKRSRKKQKATSPSLTRRSTTSMVDPTPMNQKGRKSSPPERSWRCHPPPPST